MTGRRRVLLLETIHHDAMAELETAVETVAAWSLEPGAIVSEARRGPIHAIITRGKGQVSAELMDACEGLIAVTRCGVGLDNIDCTAAADRGIAVLNLPGCNAQTIAEHTIMLLLAVMRGLVGTANAVTAGNWTSRARYDRDEVFGKTLGIIGMGNIGQRVAKIASALGMDILYTDPVQDLPDYPRTSLPELVANADAITLHCQLDASSRGLVHDELLAAMKPGVILINTARGGLVDHAAVARRIENRTLAGYGADVLDVEPPPSDHPLVGLPNVILTPHVGSLTRSTYRQICVDSVRKLMQHLDER